MDFEWKAREWIDAADIYSQYFHAECVNKEIIRRAALVKLTVRKDTERILTYEVSASFIPFENEEDFRVPDDVKVSKYVSYGSKRRMKMAEEKMLSSLQADIDGLLSELAGTARICWDRPLREPRFG